MEKERNQRTRDALRGGVKPVHKPLLTLPTPLMKSIRLLAATVLTLSLAALTSFAADPNGIWKFKAEGPKGGSMEATLVLKWENNQLSGAVENRLGKAEISEATFANDQ